MQLSARRNGHWNLIPWALAQSHLSDAYYYAHRYTDAIEQHRRALELHPTAAEPSQDLALDYLLNGMPADFLAQAERWINVCGETSSRLAAARLHQLKRTDYQEGLKILIQQALAQRKIAYASSAWIATLYAQNRETQRSLAWLETAYDERDPNLFYIAVDPAFDNVRSDPQFQRLSAQVQ
jgi:tetratricopeptide (TPR) repeat protein